MYNTSNNDNKMLLLVLCAVCRPLRTIHVHYPKWVVLESVLGPENVLSINSVTLAVLFHGLFLEGFILFSSVGSDPTWTASAGTIRKYPESSLRLLLIDDIFRGWIVNQTYVSSLTPSATPRESTTLRHDARVDVMTWVCR